MGRRHWRGTRRGRECYGDGCWLCQPARAKKAELLRKRLRRERQALRKLRG